MRKLLVTLVVSLWMPSAALAASWENVSLVDQMCLSKVKADPDKHPTSCLIKCADSGYGVMTQDGKWLKLDKAGNQMALAALKKTEKKDHVRVNVTGEKKGDEIQVSARRLTATRRLRRRSGRATSRRAPRGSPARRARRRARGS